MNAPPSRGQMADVRGAHAARMPPAGDVPAAHPPFDADAERARIAETLLRSAGRLIDGRNERQVIAGVCEALTRISGHIRLAWTWFGPSDTPIITPQVCAGPAAGYGRRLVIRRNLLTQRGPAFQALGGQAAEPFNVSAHSLYGPWRQVARRHGVRSALALPLPAGLSGAGGLFVLYADRPDYFSAVGVGLFDALAGLFGSVLTVAGERRQLERTANHDALTGLLNRHAAPLVERRLRRDTSFDPPAALLMLDLDHFKAVNDRHGHAMGDRVLQATAQALRSTVRRGDDALRWGGEEFLVCLPGSSLADAMLVADKLRRSVARIDLAEPLTCSIGVAAMAADETLADAVLRADAALYLAKTHGRDRVEAAA